MKLIQKILPLILVAFFSNLIFAQDGIGVRLDNDFSKIKKPKFYFSPINVQLLENNKKFISEVPKRVDLTETAFNCNDLALFCRLELKMEKAAKMPVKFRIGEVQYVEKMEGKY